MIGEERSTPKRQRKKTSFAGYQLYGEGQGDGEVQRNEAPSSMGHGGESVGEGHSAAAATAVADVSLSNHAAPAGAQGPDLVSERAPAASPLCQKPAAAAAVSKQKDKVPSVELMKKTPGVQNATKRILEWLQVSPLTLQEVTHRLPKLSKAKVKMVLDTLRAMGLIRLIERSYERGARNKETVELYVMNQKGEHSEHLVGAKVAIPYLTRDFSAKEGDARRLRQRAVILRQELASSEKGSAEQVCNLLKTLMKADKLLEEERFFALARAAVNCV